MFELSTVKTVLETLYQMADPPTNSTPASGIKRPTVAAEQGLLTAAVLKGARFVPIHRPYDPVQP